MTMKFTTTYTREGKWFVAHCVEIGVTSQGETLEAAENNLREAMELYLEDVPPEERKQFAERPLIKTLDLEIA